MIGTKIEATKIIFFACYNGCSMSPMKMFELWFRVEEKRECMSIKYDNNDHNEAKGSHE